MINGLNNKIEKIANLLLANRNKDLNISLFNGSTGTSLILMYYGRYSNNNQFVINGIDVLQQVINSLEKSSCTSFLSSGLAGIGWAIEHLKEEDFLETESEDLLLEIDDILLSSFEIFTKDFPIYDYLYGLQGICYYFLMRKKGRWFIEETLNTLENNAIREKDGCIKWIYYPLLKKNKPCFNLGLSHGIASTIHFLSTLFKENIFASRAKILLDGSIKFLMKQRLDTKLFFSTFPSKIPLEFENHKQMNSRLAWCYGDIGIGYTLLKVGKILDDEFLKSQAEKILLRTTKRKKPIETSVTDFGFCHGSSGLAHIYNKLYKQTNDKDFRNAADFWLDKTLIYLSNYLSNYLSSEGIKFTKNINNSFGIINGLGGVLLTLMAFSDSKKDISHNWDRMFML